ncbi:hypothetical protein M2454_002435 [Aequitasia blattaphilus]
MAMYTDGLPYTNREDETYDTITNEKIGVKLKLKV